MTQWEQVSEEFARVSIAADETPVGMDRVRAHEGALRLAQAHGSFAEEFVARLDLTQALLPRSRRPAHPRPLRLVAARPASPSTRWTRPIVTRCCGA